MSTKLVISTRQQVGLYHHSYNEGDITMVTRQSTITIIKRLDENYLSYILTFTNDFHFHNLLGNQELVTLYRMEYKSNVAVYCGGSNLIRQNFKVM